MMMNDDKFCSKDPNAIFDVVDRNAKIDATGDN